MSILGYNEDQVEKTKPIITIWAEENGIMKRGYRFGFGNGGHSENSGYTMMADGKVLRMGINSKKEKGPILVMIVVDEVEQQDYFIHLQDEENTGYVTFSKPIEVKAGSVINFVSMIDNSDATMCVVSLIVELDL